MNQIAQSCLSARRLENTEGRWGKGKMISVKKSFLVCLIPILCLILNYPLWADSDQPDCSLDKGYLKRDFLFKDRVRIYDENGRRVGTLKQDFLLEDRTNIYDRSGRKTGVLKPDQLFKDRTNMYNRDGQKQGSLKQDWLQEDRTYIYDKRGDKRGYLKQDFLLKDRTNIHLDTSEQD